MKSKVDQVSLRHHPIWEVEEAVLLLRQIAGPADLRLLRIFRSCEFVVRIALGLVVHSFLLSIFARFISIAEYR